MTTDAPDTHDEQDAGPTDPAAEPVPSDEELEEPSTEKDPGAEPKAEQPHDPEPDHEAIGIGLVEGPQST